MKILICTDGSAHAQDALRFASFFAKEAKGPVEILGVAESRGEEARVREILAHAQEILGEVQNLEALVRSGHAAEEILRELERGDYELVVLGARGRRGITRFLLGSTALRVVEHSPVSVLIVRVGRPALKKILIATAGGPPGEEDVHFGRYIAQLSGASATVLHVMSQVPLSPAAPLEDLEAPYEALLQKETGEALHVMRCLEILKEGEVEGRGLIRHGFVVDEILAEAQEGNYDLLVIGAHRASGLFRFLLDDVTRQVIFDAKIPVLVVKTKP